MCNHIGSYILNDILKAIIDAGIGKEKTQEVTLKILEVGRNYNCSDTEILDGVAKDCGVCSFYSSANNDINAEGLCPNCRQDK